MTDSMPVARRTVLMGTLGATAVVVSASAARPGPSFLGLPEPWGTAVYDITTTVLTADASTIVFPYPSGREAADYLGATDHGIIGQNGISLRAEQGDFTLAFGTSSISATLRNERKFPAGTRFWLHLAPGTADARLDALEAQTRESEAFASRTALATWIATGGQPINGRVYMGGAEAYIGKAGATVLPGLPGLSPAHPVTPQHFGAVGNNAADDTAAMQEAATYCANNALRLSIPAGTYHLTKSIEVSRLLPIVGDGPDVSVLRWVSGAQSEGIHMKSGAGLASRRMAALRDISLETEKPGTGQVAFSVDCSEQIDANGNIAPRAQTHANIRGVKIKGSNLYTLSGWNRGLAFISCLGVNISDTRLLGCIPVNGQFPVSETGLYFGGSGSPVQLTLASTYISGFHEGVRIEETEGVYIDSGCEIVNVGTGVNVVNVGVQPAFHMFNSHVAAHEKAVSLTYAAEAKIVGNAFYSYEHLGVVFVGVEVNAGCLEVDIINNSFNRTGTNTLYTCVRLNGGDYTKIDHNQMQPGNSPGCIGIDIKSTATNTFIGDTNLFRVVSQRILNASPSTFAREWPGPYIGSLDDIPTSDEMRRQTHICGTAATGGPSDLPGLVSSVVETIAYDANSAVQTLRVPTRSNWYQRGKSGGVWTQWIAYGPTP